MTFSKFDFYWSLAKAAGTELTDTEFRVLVLLANYADGKTGKRAYPSAATLAGQMGKSAKTVRRALAALVAKGWLTKVDRPGASSEYQLVTLDTQMSRVQANNPGHSDVQGPEDTLDKSDPTLDTQVSTPPGHPDVHRSDQGSDPSRIRSVTDGSHHYGQDIQDVQPGQGQDETGLGSRPLAVGGRTEAPEEGADGQGQEASYLPEPASAGSSAEPEARLSRDSDPWGGSTSEPATATEATEGHRGSTPDGVSEGATEAPEGLVGLQPPTARGGHSDDPFASEPARLADATAREERAEAATRQLPQSEWQPSRMKATTVRPRSFAERIEALQD